VRETKSDARVDHDPLLAFSIESGGPPAAPSQLEQPVAAVRVPATIQSDRKTVDSAAAMRARIDRLEKAADRSAKEIAALKAQVATLVGGSGDKRGGVASAVTAVVVGVGFGVWSWTLMSSEPIVPRSPIVTAAEAIAPAPVAVAQPPIAEAAIIPVASVTPPRNNTQHRVSPPPVDYVGALSIDSDPPGDVFIDRKPAGRTPLRAANLKAGSHLVWIERDGYHRFTRVVEVPADRVSRVVANLELTQR
jgi:hypothetical protein